MSYNFGLLVLDCSQREATVLRKVKWMRHGKSLVSELT